MIHSILRLKRKIHTPAFPEGEPKWTPLPTGITNMNQLHVQLTNQISDDTIISKIIPSIDKEGNRTNIVHTIKKKNTDNWSSLARNGNLGFYIVIPILLGLFIGISLDDMTGKKPLFTLMCLGFGVVSGIYNLIRTLKN